MSKEKAGELLESLATTAAEVLQSEADMELEKATYIGRTIAYKFAKYEGGVQIYLPKGLVQKLSLRDAEIRSKFTGFNSAQLAIEYGLTDMRIRQIIAKPKK